MKASRAGGNGSGRHLEASGASGEQPRAHSAKTGRHAPRTPRVTVTHPQMTVVESAEQADRAALDTAITLFVKWAIRAHERANPAVTEAPEAPTDHHSATREAPEAPTNHLSAD